MAVSARLNNCNTAIINLPNLHPGQLAVLDSPARFKFLSAGRRWFKTTTFAVRSLIGAIKEGKDFVWTAPTADQVSIGWDFCERALLKYRYYETQKSVATLQFYDPGNDGLKTGSIRFRSLDDPNNARGFTADEVLIDEAADVNETAWYEVLRPMLMTTRGGAIIGGTPKGRNWYFREHTKAMKCIDGTMESFVAPTLGCEIVNGVLIRKPHPLENPHILFTEIEDAYRTMPEYAFRQEILAEFMDDAGGAFQNVEQAFSIAVGSRTYNPEHQYGIGVDWGKINDYTSMAVMDLTAEEIVYIDRSNQVDYMIQAMRLMILVKKWHPQTVKVEKNSIGEAIIESLTAMGLEVDAWDNHNRAKKQIMDKLSLGLQTGTLKIVDDPVTKDQFQSYQMKVLPVSGLIQYGAPNGQHDDDVISVALVYSLHGNNVVSDFWKKANKPDILTVEQFFASVGFNKDFNSDPFYTGRVNRVGR